MKSFRCVVMQCRFGRKKKEEKKRKTGRRRVELSPQKGTSDYKLDSPRFLNCVTTNRYHVILSLCDFFFVFLFQVFTHFLVFMHLKRKQKAKRWVKRDAERGEKIFERLERPFFFFLFFTRSFIFISIERLTGRHTNVKIRKDKQAE